jgi:hypothetical protein
MTNRVEGLWAHTCRVGSNAAFFKHITTVDSVSSEKSVSSIRKHEEDLNTCIYNLTA